MNKDKIRVYVVGSQKGYACWLNCELVTKISDAQLVLFTGGEDVNPALYGQEVGSRTHFSVERDAEELNEFNTAYTLGLPMFGICRGSQFLCAMSGGTVVQHVSHSDHYHALRMWDGSTLDTNSLHHQLMNPFNLPKNEYSLLGWAEGLSHHHLNGEDRVINMPTDNQNVAIEPELVYFRKTKALCIQGHPEMMSSKARLVKLLELLVDEHIAGNLESLIAFEMPISVLLDDNTTEKTIEQKEPWELDNSYTLEGKKSKNKIEEPKDWDA